MTKPLNIAIVHPDLGIGGAERLILDVALALQSINENNKITIFTSHCDPNHCFEDAKRFHVKVYGDFLPTNLLGKFKIIFAFLRQLYLTIKLIITLQLFKFDLIVIDQLSYCIPILYLFSYHAKIIFYCHFPDKLLASHDSSLRSIYRYLFDLIEELSTFYAHKIIVNSRFTKSILLQTFRMLQNKRFDIDVIYPCVSDDQFTDTVENDKFRKSILLNNSYFLSINRFERKKNIELAINSFNKYITDTNDNNQSIIIAGGYDSQNTENFEYLNELIQLCQDLNLDYKLIKQGDDQLASLQNPPKVIFLPSISSSLKDSLILNCDLLLYTPKNEHFGIVPLEAMKLGKLVLADNSGGPLETILNYGDDKANYTGFTVDSTIENWNDVLKFVKDLKDDDLVKISDRCKLRVEQNFSFNSLKLNLQNVLDNELPRTSSTLSSVHVLVFPISLIIIKFLYNFFN